MSIIANPMRITNQALAQRMRRNSNAFGVSGNLANDLRNMVMGATSWGPKLDTVSDGGFMGGR